MPDSGTINVSFSVAPGSDVKGVKAMGPIQLRRGTPWAAEKLAESAVQIGENNFLVRLLRGDESRNIAALRNFRVLDLVVQLTDGRAATIGLEKGRDGERPSPMRSTPGRGAKVRWSERTEKISAPWFDTADAWRRSPT